MAIPTSRCGAKRKLDTQLGVADDSNKKSSTNKSEHAASNLDRDRHPNRQRTTANLSHSLRHRETRRSRPMLDTDLADLKKFSTKISILYPPRETSRT